MSHDWFSANKRSGSCSQNSTFLPENVELWKFRLVTKKQIILKQEICKGQNGFLRYLIMEDQSGFPPLLSNPRCVGRSHSGWQLTSMPSSTSPRLKSLSISQAISYKNNLDKKVKNVGVHSTWAKNSKNDQKIESKSQLHLRFMLKTCSKDNEWYPEAPNTKHCFKRSSNSVSCLYETSSGGSFLS